MATEIVFQECHAIHRDGLCAAQTRYLKRYFAKINLLDDVSPGVVALYSLVLERHYRRAEQKVPGHAPAYQGEQLWYSFRCASLP